MNIHGMATTSESQDIGHNKDNLTKEKVAQVLTEMATELSKLKIDHPGASASKKFVVCPPRLSIECY
jgi:hypothetical protein